MRNWAPNGDGASAERSSIGSSLLESVKANRPGAWQELIDLFGPLVYEWCRHSGLQPDDAADALQEVFSAVATHIAGFRRDRPGDSFRGWLWTITKNKVHDHFRRQHRQPQAEGGTDAYERLAQVPATPPDSSTTGPQGGEMSRLERRAVELVQAAVEDRTWRAFWSVTVDGQPVADVADELGMSVRAVYDAKYRVRRQICQHLSGLVE